MFAVLLQVEPHLHSIDANVAEHLQRVASSTGVSSSRVPTWHFCAQMNVLLAACCAALLVVSRCLLGYAQ